MWSATSRSTAELAQAGAAEFNRLVKAVGLTISVAGDGAGPKALERLMELTMFGENIGICGNICRIPDESDLRRVAAKVLSAD